jgi:alpha-D-ribose 1-methylphosphonate 5-triphosphate diphosphatase
VATISKAPARAAGLLDRGEIRAGLNADLLRVRKHKKQFVVQSVWRNGNRVF